MGVGRTFAEAFSKAMLGSNSGMKKQGRALLSVREGDKARVVDLAASLLKQGFELDATHGTAVVLGEAGINPRPGQQGARRASAHSGPYQERRVHLHRQHHGRPSGD